MTRHLLFLDIDPSSASVAAYRDWHRAGGPPDAINRSIRASGIESLEIWHVGDRLAMIMETGPDFSAAAKAAADAADPDVQAWEALMERFQRRLPFAPDGEKWVAAERVYSLDEQP
ncbi:MAG: L-rhamnose mutarotase [Sphingomonas sp.]|jgi:L-rhamnose mutarotase|uniref:L-rhamnose mutarotase n=1 Tax=Sphingomonas sp. CD22 TaxID=3100214 RepID=UPI001218702C|nr:L-rhamnose mutarotase [Sphingomonas sp. CD22]MEA1086154.1 L-rhamnose mutarotase [Sphingomonas sp. CD22]RZL53038.1 MAG: L-rhamnose mutarotase [Sphingomonas sp.]